jgi:hypothetical protein
MAGRVAQVEEHLPRKDEALSSNHDVTKKKKKKKQNKRKKDTSERNHKKQSQPCTNLEILKCK